MISPPPELIERFRRDFERLLGRPAAPNERIALAVSGGPDSMAMLALAAAAWPRRVIAATVDHRLRTESADEAAMVARACEARLVPHSTLAIQGPPGASGNLQAWARQQRYLLLKRWATDKGAPILCTAHHAEDQAETFLMRAARASGLSGLAAVRARVEAGVPLREQARAEPQPDRSVIFSVQYSDVLLTLRPLLRWRRQELRALAQACSLAFVDDPSNADQRFDRSRFRAWLEQADWIDPVQIGRSAEHLAEAEADLSAVSDWLWKARASLPDPDNPYEARIDVDALPRGVRRYVACNAMRIVRSFNGMNERHAPLGNIEPLLDALEAGKGATHAGVQASAKGTVWHFREAPPRRPPRPK